MYVYAIYINICIYIYSYIYTYIYIHIIYKGDFREGNDKDFLGAKMSLFGGECCLSLSFLIYM